MSNLTFNGRLIAAGENTLKSRYLGLNSVGSSVYAYLTAPLGVTSLGRPVYRVWVITFSPSGSLVTDYKDTASYTRANSIYASAYNLAPNP